MYQIYDTQVNKDILESLSYIALESGINFSNKEQFHNILYKLYHFTKDSFVFDKGIQVLSVYAFSTENFKRSEEEVKYLMDIFVEWFNKECDQIHDEDIKVVFSGRKENLRPDVLEAMEVITERTKDNKKGIFNICLNYGGQQEIVDATKRIAEEVKEGKLSIEDINTEMMYKYMYQELPPVDFMIRTSGEERVSNFLIYEISYAEMYFPEVKFPDFNEEEFEKAIDEYNKRDRRFGGNTK